MKRERQKGFTILELTISVLLGGAVAYILYATLIAGKDVFTGVAATQEVDSNIDAKLEMIARDIQSAGTRYRDAIGLYWEDYYAAEGYTGYSPYASIYPLLYDWYSTPGNWSYYIYFRQNKRVSFNGHTPVVSPSEVWGPIVYYASWIEDGETSNGIDDDHDGYVDERGLWRYEYAYWTTPYRYVYKQIGRNLEYVRFTWANPEHTAVRIQIRAAKRRGVRYTDAQGDTEVKQREVVAERELVVFLRNE